MIKYKITKRLWREPKISQVKIKRETEYFIFFSGHPSKLRKFSDYDNFYDTYSQARDALIAFADSKIDIAEINLEVAKKYLSDLHKNIGTGNEK